MTRRTLAAMAALLLCSPGAGMSSPADLDVTTVDRFVRLALECAHREYPNKIAHVLSGPEDVAAPQSLTPAFYGCFDWHSSVHGHWLLARSARLFPDAEFAPATRAALARSLTAENIAAEVDYLRGEGRATFERPYGLAWLLQLANELRGWDDPEAAQWARVLEPLEKEAAQRFRDWLPKLTYAIRTGEHSQTAFALGLVHDWARRAEDQPMLALVKEKVLAFHAGDTDCNLGYEPSGQDFLSPCLAEADLVRRVLAPEEFAVWLDRFLPGIPRESASASWLPVAIVSDRSDGKLAHLDGLNLSRAWMLEGISNGLPAADPRRASLRRAADEHRQAGLDAVTGEHYEGGHWLGSFAMYLVSGSGAFAAMRSEPEPPAKPTPWELCVDTGGTFTDGLAVSPDGRQIEVKVLSNGALRARVSALHGARSLELDTAWDLPDDFFAGTTLHLLGAERSHTVTASRRGGRELHFDGDLHDDLTPGARVELSSSEEAPVLAARVATKTRLGEPLPPMRMRLATTRGTNALLEHRGARTALVVTAGFADLLRIGTQQRPDLFAVHVERPDPLPAITIEAHERVGADGQILQDLDDDRLRADIEALRRHDVQSVAIALLHSYRNPAHEQRVEAQLREAGFEHVTRSSAVAPFQQLLLRAQTSVVDAYLAPVIGSYLRSVRASLGRHDHRLHVMTSAGGLVASDEYRPKDSLLSGPAGGVVGAAAAGRAAGFGRILSLDMGGTSTDVARVDGDFEYVFAQKVGDSELLAPALAIETVAAGGGSICGVEHGRLVVGPESAGAFPGSACYGAGGPLTLTDVNLLLGRIRPERLPIPIDVDAAQARWEELARGLEAQTGAKTEPVDLLEGWLRIANERMADAIRQVSLRRGYDPREYALLAFGGAGGQHACAIAELLGIETILAPPSAGILSARGLQDAQLERFVERQVLAPLETAEPKLAGWLTQMGRVAVDAVVQEGAERERVEVARQLLELRYGGQDSTLVVEVTDGASIRDQFEARHEELFGHNPRGKSLELVSVRVVARLREAPASPLRADDVAAKASGRRALDLDALATVRCSTRGQWAALPCIERASLEPGDGWKGPALVVEDHALLFVETGWSAVVDASGAIVATRSVATSAAAIPRGPSRTEPDAVTLELFRHRFESIAREMGEVLRRTAISTNVKERLDFSCALLDPDGRLVVNAPHIPVHLGALGLCVRTLRESVSLDAGDIVVTNHPRYGGSHLPDVTVVAPVHDGSGRNVGTVAVRAHHAEIGGVTPGSMPPDARCLAHEGVVLPPIHLARRGEVGWQEVEDRLQNDAHPTRALSDNLADLRAMVAAARGGVRRLQELAKLYGDETLAVQMDSLRALACRHVRSALREFGDGVYRAEDSMDDGSKIRVKIEIAQGRARLDFTGSAEPHPGNLNATEAIVRSAVLYVLRLLVREPLPLNEGLMEAVELVLPRGMLNPHFPDDPNLCPAIVGGNVETSQRIVDTLLRAFGLAAASQGTMNNVSFGDEQFGYYETLGGGTGAGEGHRGASGVHSHMTNTRLTDVEVLEHRYPVRVQRLALRRGSGGRGRWLGGEGIERELEFLAPVTLSVFTQRRSQAPYGMAGGGPGAVGSQSVLRADGQRVELKALDRIELGAGDRFVIRTPGGGGYGPPEAIDTEDAGS